jgi:hypothetical protein
MVVKLSTAGIERVLERIRAAEACGEINGWEATFLRDNRERIEKDPENAAMSQNQHYRLEQIFAKVEG